MSAELQAEARKLRQEAPSVLVAAADALDGGEPGRAVRDVFTFSETAYVGALALARCGVGWRDRIGRE